MEFCSPVHIKQEPIDNFENAELVSDTAEEIDYRSADTGVNYQLADDKLTTGKTIHDIISSIRKSKNGGSVESESVLPMDDYSVYDYSQESNIIDKHNMRKTSDGCGEICLFCGQTFNKKGEMEKHVRVYHGSKASSASSEFQSKEEMSSKGYKCDICFGNYRSIRAFLTHRSSHFSRHKGAERLQESLSALYGNNFFSAYINGFQGQQMFVCQSCKSVFRTRDSYAMHMLMRARGESCKSGIEEHIGTDHVTTSPQRDNKETKETKRGDETEAIDMSTGSFRDIIVGIASPSSTETPPPNERCDYSRDQKKCMYCKMGFSDQDSLAMHVMSDHANDMLLGGSVKTGDSNRRDLYKSHSTNSNQRSDTACEDCNVTFSSKDSLAMHMLWHAKEHASTSGTVSNISTKVVRKIEISEGDYSGGKRMKCDMTYDSMVENNHRTTPVESAEKRGLQNGPSQGPANVMKYGSQNAAPYLTRLLILGSKSRNENYNFQGSMDGPTHLQEVPGDPEALLPRPNSVPMVAMKGNVPKDTKQTRPTSTGVLDNSRTITNYTQVRLHERSEQVRQDSKRKKMFTQRLGESCLEHNSLSAETELNPTTDRCTDVQTGNQGRQDRDRRCVLSSETTMNKRENRNSFMNDYIEPAISRSKDVFKILSQSGHPFSVCKFCRIIYLDKTLYQLHMGLHNVNNPWQCNVCGKVCKDVHEFSTHVVHSG